MAKEKISDEVKTFIVQSSACFDSPSEVVAEVKKEFGIEITRQYVESLDHTKKAGAKTAKCWRVLFDKTREAFIEKTADIPAANRSVRVKRLERMAVKAEAMKNFALAATIYEQIAKEVGDVYTNKRQLSGPGGKPIEASVTHSLDDASLKKLDDLLG